MHGDRVHGDRVHGDTAATSPGEGRCRLRVALLTCALSFLLCLFCLRCASAGQPRHALQKFKEPVHVRGSRTDAEFEQRHTTRHHSVMGGGPGHA